MENKEKKVFVGLEYEKFFMKAESRLKFHNSQNELAQSFSFLSFILSSLNELQEHMLLSPQC
jgi:hypothetical protein